MKSFKARIAGTGMYVPEKILTNKDLEKLMDTTDEWIQQRSGIKERRVAPEGLGASDLGIQAAKRAMEAARVNADAIDLVLFATLSPDYYFPGSAVFVQDALGMQAKPAMDIRCQCSGFLYSLSVANSFIVSGQYERILVIGAEAHSRGLNYTTQGRDVAVLFGDGAGAVIVERATDDVSSILSIRLHSEGQYRDRLKMQYPSMRNTPFCSKEMIDQALIYPTMDGKFVFKHAVERMPEVVNEVLEAEKLNPNEVNHYIFHQANLRINEATMKVLGQPLEKTYNNIDRYGNCSAASIPMCLDECARSGRIKKGDLVCMASFGAGFTWAGAVVKW